MKYQKTILVAALMAAMGGVVHAQDWEEPKEYTNITGEGVLFDGDTTLATGAYLTTEANNTGHGVASISGEAQILTLSSGEKLWVVAKDTEENKNPIRIFGMRAVGGATVQNSGTLFVKSEGDQWGGYARGLLISQGGKAVNSSTGIIFVDNAIGMQTTNEKGAKTFENHGLIKVVNNGYAIDGSSSAEGEVNIKNFGTIELDETSWGIRISDAQEKESVVTINNSGAITGGKFAISVEDTAAGRDVAINLSEKSHVEGLIFLSEAVDVTMTISELANKESIQVAGAIDSLQVSASDITINQVKNSTLTVNNIDVDDKSGLTFRLNEIAETPVLTVSAADGKNLDRVSYAFSGTISDEIAAEENFDVARLFSSISANGGAVEKVSVEEGQWGNSLLVTANADNTYNTQVLSENSLLRSAKDLALTNALVWRSELTSLSDRMGTLRTHPESTGAWARYTGGNLEGKGVDFDFNSVEIGFDVPVTNTMTLGMSFGYTKGDSDLVSGSADSDSYKLGLYATYMHESGSFLDAMLKVGRIDASYDLNNGVSESGDYMYTGVIAGIETGHRWTLNQFYVEPQIQLTYSYLQAETYSTDIRTVDFDSTKSLIGRIGFMAGMNFAQDKGSAYMKAAYNHDFLGDMTGRFYSATHNISFSEELDQNWGEVSLGASYSMTDSLNGFVDVSRTFGGDIDQKWRVNLGARYQF